MMVSQLIEVYCSRWMKLKLNETYIETFTCELLHLFLLVNFQNWNPTAKDNWSLSQRTQVLLEGILVNVLLHSVSLASCVCLVDIRGWSDVNTAQWCHCGRTEHDNTPCDWAKLETSPLSPWHAASTNSIIWNNHRLQSLDHVLF